MRCYHFGNYYLSSIQQGIQASHCQMELFVKYPQIDLTKFFGMSNAEHIVRSANLANTLFVWAKHHKTMVCLNGGNNKDLHEIKVLFEQDNNAYPWSYFCEDEDSLGSVLTNVAIVLPEKIYDAAEKIRNNQASFSDNSLYANVEHGFIDNFTDFEIKLIEILNKCQLAK